MPARAPYRRSESVRLDTGHVDVVVDVAVSAGICTSDVLEKEENDHRSDDHEPRGVARTGRDVGRFRQDLRRHFAQSDRQAVDGRAVHERRVHDGHETAVRGGNRMGSDGRSSVHCQCFGIGDDGSVCRDTMVFRRSDGRLVGEFVLNVNRPYMS